MRAAAEGFGIRPGTSRSCINHFAGVVRLLQIVMERQVLYAALRESILAYALFVVARAALAVQAVLPAYLLYYSN